MVWLSGGNGTYHQHLVLSHSRALQKGSYGHNILRLNCARTPIMCMIRAGWFCLLEYTCRAHCAEAVAAACAGRSQGFVCMTMYDDDFVGKAERLLRSCHRFGVCCVATRVARGAFDIKPLHDAHHSGARALQVRRGYIVDWWRRRRFSSKMRTQPPPCRCCGSTRILSISGRIRNTALLALSLLALFLRERAQGCADLRNTAFGIDLC